MAETATTILESASEATSRFNSTLADTGSLDVLRDSLAVVTRAIGFDVFILLQLPRRNKQGDVLLVTSYPDEWMRSAIANQNYMDDPVIAAARSAEVAFVWGDIAQIISISVEQSRYMERARAFGISDGFTIPFRLPGEPIGLVSFATRENAVVNATTLPFAYQIASNAFNRARAIKSLDASADRERLALTSNEVHAVRIAAQGKSDFLIGRILGVPRSEIAKLLKSAQRKLGSTCRLSMVLMAIDLGYFTLDEALFG